MQNIATAACFSLLALVASGQQKEGKVTYERTIQMQMSFSGMNDEMQRMIPRNRSDKFELVFSNSQSLWRAAEKDNEDESMSGGDGVQVRMIVAGANDVLFTNLDSRTRVEQRELFDKKFIIDDSIRQLKWKIAGETKSILNHNCMKATATQIVPRMMMTVDNGVTKRKEIQDTSQIVAWFASDIPVSAGPGEYQGQLPGLILEMDINNGRQVYKAIEVSPKADLAIIKEPSGKKHYTPAEFRKEREKMMDEMQRNNSGGSRVIRVN